MILTNMVSALHKRRQEEPPRPAKVVRAGSKSNRRRVKPLHYKPSPSGTYSSWGKTIFDVSVAGIVTVGILCWLIPLIGLAIRLESSGPVLFVQIRSGRNGRKFPCLKFRTMKYDPQAAFQQATRDDLRVTRLGKFLRKTNLDEMPQFLNVLAGHMSIVGPRPHPIQLDEEYWPLLSNYHKRYSVRPGITGLAQARGARGETRESGKMKQRVRYDHLYIRRQSLALDMKICLWTVKSMVKGNKNAF